MWTFLGKIRNFLNTKLSALSTSPTKTLLKCQQKFGGGETQSDNTTINV